MRGRLTVATAMPLVAVVLALSAAPASARAAAPKQTAHAVGDAGTGLGIVRILPNSAPTEQLRELLNPTKVPDFEASATVGTGVFDTLKAVAKLVLTELKKGSGG